MAIVSMTRKEQLNAHLSAVQSQVYTQLSLQLTNLQNQQEGTEYDACTFELDGRRVISRSAKSTPKKLGQFVTFWKRNEQGVTAPYAEHDLFDFYVVNINAGDCLGQFVFSKSVLLQQGYITSEKKPGKRGFRVYTPWDTVQSRQALKTQQWQLKYFYKVSPKTDLNAVSRLYAMT